MCCRGADYLYAPCGLSCGCSLLPQSVRAGLLFLCPRSPSFLLSVSPTLQSPFGFPVTFYRSYRLSGSPIAIRLSNRLPALLLPSGSPVALQFSYCLPVLPLPCSSPVAFRFSGYLPVLRISYRFSSSLIVSPALHSPFGSLIVSPALLLPSGSPVALQFSYCLPVLPLPCSSPVAFRFSGYLPVLRISYRFSSSLIVSPALHSPFGSLIVSPALLLPCGSPVAFRLSNRLSASLIAFRSSRCLPVLLSSLLAFCVLIQRERAGDLSPAPCHYAICLRCLRRTLIISSLKYNSCLPST